MDLLALLRDDLRAGLKGLPTAWRQRHAEWLAAQQRAGGGFANRRGKAELYYTTFALRALSALDQLTPRIATAALDFLSGCLERKPSPFGHAVWAVSWWDALVLCEESAGRRYAEPQRQALVLRTREELERLRRPDGGYAKTAEEGSGSLYHTFLAACATQRMGAGQADPGPALEFLKRLAQPGGGYLENRHSKRPGVNGTAAGVSLALLLRAQALGLGGEATNLAALPAALRRWLTREFAPHARFLLGQQTEEGGFRAAEHAPFADLLSTFTALLTLRTLGRLSEKTTAAAKRYAEQLEAPEGGYMGFALEERADCEYTFYGLGVLRLAAGAQ